ncbi:YciI family protein [Devosia beringensis]|uniref:YciI family protein n=1 Tax=Devosia beringensis TaxID=2657486 RepID=UPI00186B9D73|nr:YciI family protein [Devosia beringensis]
MQFMLLIHGDERISNAATPPDATVMSPAYTAYNAALVKSGAMIAGSRLRPTSDATSVRIRNGRTEVLNGPYAETKEQFGGYYLIEAPDLDAAMDWATKCPATQTGTIEVRPVVAN